MDDASTDRSVEFIRGYRVKHPDLPIHLHINEKNAGLTWNVFEAATLGRGAYFWMVAGDNTVPEDIWITGVLASLRIPRSGESS